MLPSVMAKHRHLQEDPPSLDSESLGKSALSLRRHAIIAAAVASLTLAGATGWALTRPDSGSGSDSPRGAGPGAMTSPGALEGFGLASPMVSASGVRPGPRASGSSPLPSLLPPSLEVVTPTESATTTSGLEATYTMLTWQGGYQVTLVLTNPTAANVLWRLRIQLPSNASFGHSWGAELSRDGAVLTFTPPKWDSKPMPLAPGTTHSFGFSALQTSGDYRLLSCAVDGVVCRAVQS